MLDIAKMDSDAKKNLSFERRRTVPLAKFRLDVNRTPDRRQCAGKLNQKTVANRVNLTTVMERENCPNHFPMFLQQFQRERFVPLRQCAVTDEVGEHDSSQSAVFRSA